VLFAELIVAIETTFIGVKNYATSSGDIAPIINRLALSTKQAVKQSSLITLQDREIASSLRSAVHLKGNLNLITGLEDREVVSQLLGICVLCKKRCGRNRLLAGSVAIGRPTSPRVGTRNILAANLVAIYYTINDSPYA
jgi:uncharacterized Fe-S radical SAM superfamily protein PflX